MKCFCSFLLLFLFSTLSIAEKSADKPIAVDPNDVDGSSYVDPYDVNESGTSDGKYIDPYDVQTNETGVDPFDLPNQPEKKPEKKEPKLKLNTELFADVDDWWRSWNTKHISSPKPPLEWRQVGTEIGAGYVGAFGGSVAGLFTGFLVGSLYDAVSSCEQCWVDVAVGMGTFGATIGASAGVYMFGNNEVQQGSLFATYASSVLPVLISTIAYSGSRRINRSTFNLAAMPLFATLGFNLTRHYRKKGETPLFENIFVDDMWVSKGKNDVIALNMQFSF